MSKIEFKLIFFLSWFIFVWQGLEPDVVYKVNVYAVVEHEGQPTVESKELHEKVNNEEKPLLVKFAVLPTKHEHDK